MDDRCLRNVSSSQVIPCSIILSPEVLIRKEELLEDNVILLIIDTNMQYAHKTQYCSPERAARLLRHRAYNH